MGNNSDIFLCIDTIYIGWITCSVYNLYHQVCFSESPKAGRKCLCITIYSLFYIHISKKSTKAKSIIEIKISFLNSLTIILKSVITLKQFYVYDCCLFVKHSFTDTNLTCNVHRKILSPQKSDWYYSDTTVDYRWKR